jgi:hypothetical protein
LAKTLPRWYFTVRVLMDKPAADLRVRQAVTGPPRDLGLLGGQLAAGVDSAFFDAARRCRGAAVVGAYRMR